MDRLGMKERGIMNVGEMRGSVRDGSRHKRERIWLSERERPGTARASERARTGPGAPGQANAMAREQQFHKIYNNPTRLCSGRPGHAMFHLRDGLFCASIDCAWSVPMELETSKSGKGAATIVVGGSNYLGLLARLRTSDVACTSSEAAAGTRPGRGKRQGSATNKYGRIQGRLLLRHLTTAVSRSCSATKRH
jgi:hypothetical protein